jgi:hypothetical protein
MMVTSFGWVRWRKRIQTRIDEDGSFIGIKDKDVADAVVMPPPSTTQTR